MKSCFVIKQFAYNYKVTCSGNRLGLKSYRSKNMDGTFPTDLNILSINPIFPSFKKPKVEHRHLMGEVYLMIECTYDKT